MLAQRPVEVKVVENPVESASSEVGVDCMVDVGEKLSKAAKRKRRKKILTEFWDQFQ